MCAFTTNTTNINNNRKPDKVAILVAGGGEVILTKALIEQTTIIYRSDKARKVYFVGKVVIAGPISPNFSKLFFCTLKFRALFRRKGFHYMRIKKNVQKA